MRQTMKSKERLWILSGIVLISLIVKLTLFLVFYHGDVHQVLQPDSGTYLIPTKALLQHANYGGMFERTPGYPTFMALLFYLFGYHLSVVIIAQLLLSGIPIICAYWIGRRLFNENIGLVIAAFVAVDYLFFSYAYFILTDYLYALTLGLTFLFGVLLLTGDTKYKYAFFMGLFFAIATLIRPVNYYLIFPILVGVFIYLLSLKLPWKKVSMILLWIFLPTLLLVGGWQVRNKLTIGTFQYSGITSPGVAKIFFPANYALYAKTHDIHQSNYLKTNFEVLTDHPFLVIKQMGKGFVKLMMGSNPIMVDFFSRPEYISAYLKIQHEFLSGNFNNAITKLSQSSTSLIIFLYKSGLTVINLFLYFFLGVGLFLLHRENLLKPKKFAHLFLIGSALYLIALCSNASSYARFRLPFQLTIDIYAAVGCVMVWEKFKQKSDKVN